MSYSDLMDLETLVLVKRAAPQVTVVPFDVACWVVRGMAEFSAANKASVDQNGQMYWQSTVKALHAAIHVGEEVSLGRVGRALKAMGIDSWRKMDGFHIAWSSAQLEILKKYFKA
jgi:hypothetical protein